MARPHPDPLPSADAKAMADLRGEGRAIGRFWYYGCTSGNSNRANSHAHKGSCQATGNKSTLAAKTKSLSVRPSILWVQSVNFTFPHAR
jgi:hypothetical protein